MNLYSKKTIKDLFEEYQIKPLKGLGQNFLIDRLVAKKIIEAAELSSKDIVLEIGPGFGNLTLELAKRAKRVIGVEKDPKMVEILKETLKDFKNIEVILGDILKIQKSKVPPDFACDPPAIVWSEGDWRAGRTRWRAGKIQNYKVVANLPYYIVSPVIRKFLESENPPSQMVLMVQKEVAQRICASPSQVSKKFGRARPPNMSILAVSVQFYAEPKIVSYVSKKSFWPSPKVDSAIIRITPQITADKKQINADLFFKIVKAGFSHPRKQLVNNLANGLKIDKVKTEKWLLKNKIQPNQRAETLSVENWIILTKNYDEI